MGKALYVLMAVFFVFGGLANATDDVNSGTVLQGTLVTALSTATAQVGDRVVISNVHDDSGSINGSLYGHVTQVQPAGRGRQAQLNFVLDRLSTNDATYAVTAESKGILPPGVSAGKQSTALIVGALAGLLAGKALGHSTGSMIAGVVAGAGIGFLLTSNNYQDIALQPGSSVKVLLTSVTRMQSQ